MWRNTILIGSNQMNHSIILGVCLITGFGLQIDYGASAWLLSGFVFVVSNLMAGIMLRDEYKKASKTMWNIDVDYPKEFHSGDD